jgi:hypothetical protein
MRTDPDVTRAVRSWLQPGVTELPDRVLDKVLDALPATPQRRPFWSAWRFRPMNSAFKPAMATAAVVLAGFVGLTLLQGSGPPGVAAPGSASPAGSASLAPLTQSRPVPSAGPMTAGRYHFDVQLYNYLGSHAEQPGATPPLGADGDAFPGGTARVTFDVPAGWSGEGGSAILKGGAQPPDGLAFAAMTIDRVYLDPCRWEIAESRGAFADPPLMRSLDGLAEALTAWWGVGFAAPAPTLPPDASFGPTLPSATQPTTVALGGLEGRYVEVRTPADLELTDCDSDQYTLWADATGGQRYVQGPGELDRLWIVDLDGTTSRTEDDGSVSDIHGGLLVIDAASHPETSPEDLAELQAIIDSIDIDFQDAPG